MESEHSGDPADLWRAFQCDQQAAGYVNVILDRYQLEVGRMGNSELIGIAQVFATMGLSKRVEQLVGEIVNASIKLDGIKEVLKHADG